MTDLWHSRKKPFETRQSVAPSTPRGAKKFIEEHPKSSRDAIGTEAFLGHSDVTSTEKMENMFLGADTDKKCGDGDVVYCRRDIQVWQGT